MTITLNMKEMLPIIRAAFDAKTLQMFSDEHAIGCLYAGPCAIGVCLSPEDREMLDTTGDDASIWNYFAKGMVKTADDTEDWETLQAIHDSATCVSYQIEKEAEYERFETFLKELESKYA